MCGPRLATTTRLPTLLVCRSDSDTCVGGKGENLHWRKPALAKTCTFVQGVAKTCTGLVPLCSPLTPSSRPPMRCAWAHNAFAHALWWKMWSGNEQSARTGRWHGGRPALYTRGAGCPCLLPEANKLDATGTSLHSDVCSVRGDGRKLWGWPRSGAGD